MTVFTALSGTLAATRSFIAVSLNTDDRVLPYQHRHLTFEINPTIPRFAIAEHSTNQVDTAT